MKKNVLILAAVVVSGFFPVLAADDKKVDVSKLPPASAQKGVTFDKDIKPIFEAACVKCHGPEKQKGKFRTDSLAAVLKGGENGPTLKAGNSADSPLVHFVGYLIEDSEMPPLKKDGGSQQLPKEQIALIRAWIDQGAK